MPYVAPFSIAVAVGMFAGLFLDQERRWRRSDQSEPTLFLPDGQPAMQVRGIPAGRRPVRLR